MFDHSIISLPSYAKKRDAISAVLSKHHEAGTLTYTDIMLNDSELMTIAFELLDGVTKTGDNIPQYDPSGREFDIGPVRLVSLDTDFKIKPSKWFQPLIPGTSVKGPRIKVAKDQGTDVTLDDRLEDGRQARILLINHGWPIRQYKSRTGDVGRVIEWKWFERVSTSADATDEYRDLYATIKARIEAPRAATEKKITPPAGRQQENRP